MRQTLRVQFSLKIAAFNLLKRAANRKSMSELVSELILQKLQDPIKVLQAENQELAKKINENQEKIKHLEKQKGE